MSNPKQPTKESKARGNINDLVKSQIKLMERDWKKSAKVAGAIVLLACIGVAFFIHLAPAAFAMAGVKFALLYASPDGAVKSGRAGSVVYMRNGRRRNFVVPPLVRNAYTSMIRSAFQTNSSAFRGLAFSDQQTWNNASNVYMSNRFGTPVLVKGKALFVKCNQNLANIGLPFIPVFPSSAVAPNSMDTLTSQYVVTPTPSFEISGTVNGVASVPAGATLLVFATAILDSGISHPGQSKFRLIATVATGTTLVSHDILTAYQSKFGTLVSNGRIYVQCKLVSIASGLNSAIAQCEAVES